MHKVLGPVSVIAILLLSFRINKILFVAVVMGLLFLFFTSGIKKINIMKANAKFNSGDIDGAAKVYEKYINAKKASVDERITYANLMLRLGNPKKTLEQMNFILSFSKATVGDQKYNSAKLTRSIANLKCGNNDDAYEEAREVFFDNEYKTIESYCILTYIMIALHEDPAEIVEICEDAYDYDEENRDIIDNLFICYFRLGDLEQAEELSEILTRDYPNFVEAYYHGALMQLKLGNIEKAKEYINHLDECEFKYMTTVSNDEIESIKKAIQDNSANEFISNLERMEKQLQEDRKKYKEELLTQKPLLSDEDDDE